MSNPSGDARWAAAKPIEQIARRGIRMNPEVGTFKAFEYVQLRDLAVKCLRDCVEAAQALRTQQLMIHLESASSIVQRLAELEEHDVPEAA